MKWGLLGFGTIAPSFAESLAAAGQEISAIASKSGINRVAALYPSAQYYDDYQKLIDSDVEVVYISTVHVSHAKWSIAAMKAGKHVVCEKPAGISYQEVERMIRAAEDNDVFFMEGMWTRFLPAYRRMKELVEELGEIHLVKADFSFKTDQKEDQRLLNPVLAGGSLYDVGVYNISLVNDLFNEFPESFSTMIKRASTGVDAGCAVLMQYKNSAIAQLYSGIQLETSQSAEICGENGWIRMPEFWHVQRLQCKINGHSFVEDLPFISTGYYHEIMAVVQAVDQGFIETEIFSHQDSLAAAYLVDQLIESME